MSRPTQSNTFSWLAKCAALVSIEKKQWSNANVFGCLLANVQLENNNNVKVIELFYGVVCVWLFVSARVCVCVFM